MVAAAQPGDAGPLIRLEGINKAFVPGSLVLQDVDLEIARGEVHALLGENGAGKSTLMNVLIGLVTPGSGRARIGGRDVDFAHFGPGPAVESGIAMVHQHSSLVPGMTVEENLKIGGVTRSGAERQETLQEVTELFPVLRDKWETAAGFLSGGEAQQLAIARALMSRPRLIMMDEPSLGLAPILVDQVFALIDTLREQGRTILVVEQNATRMLEAADRAYVLRSGEVVADGTGAELLDRTDLFDTFVGG